MDILLLRHGKTSMNQDGRYQGKTDVPLCPEGAEALRRGGILPEVQRVYVSPLSRARETAAICFPHAEQRVISGFSEMDFGSFEGKNYKEMEHDPDYRAWVDGMCRGKCPDGESMAEFIHRTAVAFLSVLREAAELGEKSLIITAHGGTLMALLSHLGSPCRDYYDYGVKNGQGFQCRWAEPDFPPVLTDIQCFSCLHEVRVGGFK